MSTEKINYFDRIVNLLKDEKWLSGMWEGDWNYVSIYCKNGIFKVVVWKEKPQLVDGEWKGWGRRERVFEYYRPTIVNILHLLFEVNDGVVEINDGVVVWA